MKLEHNWKVGDLFYYGSVSRTWWPDKTRIFIPFKVLKEDEDSGILEAISLEGETAKITTDKDLQHMRPCPVGEAEEFAKNLLKDRQKGVEVVKNETSKKLIAARRWKLACTKKLLPELGFEIQG